MLEGESLSSADRKFRATFPRLKVGRAPPLLRYERALCVLPVAVGSLGSVAHRASFITHTSSKRLNAFWSKVARKVRVPVLLSEESDAIRARFPAFLPWARRPCPGGVFWRGSSSIALSPGWAASPMTVSSARLSEL